MFEILIKKLYWINEVEDDENDLCLHGDLKVTIGDEVFEESCTVSATALYLLKSLKENHIINEENQMLPCCGHFFIIDENNDSVTILGCPNGVDWTILHEKDNIKIITEKSFETIINYIEYRDIVFKFADEIEQYYKKCKDKKLPIDKYERDSYNIFWKEWHNRRN